MLAALDNPPETELIIIKTSGDQIQDIPLSQASANDRKGFFTKEIEDAMLEGKIDMAVHSYKDMPTAKVPGLKITCMPERISPLDFLVFPSEKRRSREFPFIDKMGLIGSSSLRRQANMRYLCPDIRFAEIRGNVPTRIMKTRQTNGPDAVILSGAGISRLLADPQHKAVFTDMELMPISPDLMPPAPAQGALALQCRDNDAEIAYILLRLHDEVLASHVEAEREILTALEGGCHLPLGAYCNARADGYRMYVFLGENSKDNRKKKSLMMIREGESANQLASNIIEEILKEIPVFLVGLKESVERAKQSLPSTKITALPILKARKIEGSDYQDYKRILKNVLQHSTNDNDIKIMFAVFSATTIAFLKELLDEANLTLPPIAWAVTGLKTKQRILDLFPGQTEFIISPDGTGSGLAEFLIANNLYKKYTLAFSARGGREEFYRIMQKARLDVPRIELYMSELFNCSFKLPEKCYILFGSPASVDAFFSHKDFFPAPDHLYCAIGPTTKEAIQKKGYPVYATGTRPGYIHFVNEVLIPPSDQSNIQG